jgi:hypothetical protein
MAMPIPAAARQVALTGSIRTAQLFKAYDKGDRPDEVGEFEEKGGHL